MPSVDSTVVLFFILCVPCNKFHNAVAFASSFGVLRALNSAGG